MFSVSATGRGGHDRNQIQHNLFDEIDSSGNGSIDRGEVEAAVRTAGGTTAAADALYARLDPRNTGRVSEPQFRQNLPPLPLSDGIGAQMMVFQADGWPGGSSSSPAAQTARNLFARIDTRGSGAITRTDLETAVTKAGGTVAAADALYARLDPDKAGRVSAQQFISLLSQARPHRHHHHGRAGSGGDSVQDALAALLERLFPSDDAGTTASSAAGDSGATARTGVTAIRGQTAADALWALLNTTGSTSSADHRTGTSGTLMQAALLAMSSGNFSLSGSAAPDPLLALMGCGTGMGTGMGMGIGIGMGIGGNFGLFAGATSNPLLSLMGMGMGFGLGAGGSIFDLSGTSRQSTLLALLQTTGTLSSNRSGSRSSLNVSGLDLPSAIKLYQHNLNQQMFDAMFDTERTN